MSVLERFKARFGGVEGRALCGATEVDEEATGTSGGGEGGLNLASASFLAVVPPMGVVVRRR